MATQAQSVLEDLWNAIQDHETARIAFVTSETRDFEEFNVATKRLAEAYAAVGTLIASQNNMILGLNRTLSTRTDQLEDARQSLAGLSDLLSAVQKRMKEK